jgi:hypothetical protein
LASKFEIVKIAENNFLKASVRVGIKNISLCYKIELYFRGECSTNFEFA